MDRKEAAEFLNVSEKTVSRYVANGKLPASRIGQSLVIDVGDLERLKTELATPVPATATETPRDTKERDKARQASTFLAVPTPSQTNTALALLEETRRDIADLKAGQDSARQGTASVPIADKPLLTLPEAQALTGLSRGILKAAIEGGELKAKQIGRAWRVKRADLEKWVEVL